MYVPFARVTFWLMLLFALDEADLEALRAPAGCPSV